MSNINTLNAKRYRVKDIDGIEYYVIVSGVGDEPHEIFLTHQQENDIKLQGKLANVTCITRFVSKALSYDMPLTEVLYQLNKSSRRHRDLPCMLRLCLERYCYDNSGDLSNNCRQKWYNVILNKTDIFDEDYHPGNNWYKIPTI